MHWWAKYGDFEADASGQYPLAGQVVAHYREQVGFTRAQVASQLGIGEKALYYAEHECRGLDSIARLRQVGAALSIPLALLGLCSAPGGENWWIAEYGSFPSGDDGWPDAGAVIRFYRRRKGWTQYDLAESLGIAELGVRNMERKQTGLGSLSRRRALRFLLGVPPILLGLDGVHGAPAVVHAAAATSTLPTLDDLHSAQSRLWSGYYTGDGLDQLSLVKDSLFTLKSELPLMSAPERSAYLEQASQFYQAAGNVTLATGRMSVVLSYMNAGIECAQLFGDSFLLSTALGRRAAALYELGDLASAEKSVKDALDVVSKKDRVKRYPVASRVLSARALDRADRAEVFQMLDSLIENDQYNKGDDINVLIWCRAQAMINLSENAPDRTRLLRQASELLDRAELTAPNTIRRHLIIKLEQARAYAGLREFEYALSSAIEAFGLMRQIKSVLYAPQLAEVYHTIAASLSSPQVAHLGLLLFQCGGLSDGRLTH